MVKIITATECFCLESALEQAVEILNEEGYDDEAAECFEALKIIANLDKKNIEDMI